jgi:hypothetical protein
MEGATEGAVPKKLQGPSNQRFFLWQNFAAWGRNKKGLMNVTKRFFWEILLKKLPYLEEKNLEAARFRQCCCTSPELGRLPN